jgi:hypothetical protein
MPIRFHLNGERFDPETIRVMGLAYEMAHVALEHTDGTTSPTRAAVAQKIIDLAKAGERNGALKATQPMAPAWISDPSPLPPHASPPAHPARGPTCSATPVAPTITRRQSRRVSGHRRETASKRMNSRRDVNRIKL